MNAKLKKVIAKTLASLLVVSNIAVAVPAMTTYAASTEFTTVGGFNETLYATIKGVKDSDVTEVSYSGTLSGSLTGDDFEYLVRDNSNGVRIDIPGLKAGTYTLTVKTKNGTYTKSNISVAAQDRSGYAHFNSTEGVGAYNDDGTLKDGAIVIYVTDATKNTVTLNYQGTTVSGIGNILNSVGKACGEAGHENECKKISGGKTYYGIANTNQGIMEKLAKADVPLVVRFIGTVSDSGLYKSGTFSASSKSLIDGLTAYDCNDYGGSEGDNGHMARIKSAKNVTLEGIGTDAVIDGWGFHFMAETANPTLGKNFEVRNLKFINTPEDAIGMEGVQEGSTITASVERCWIHNNEFYCPSISSPAESDKSEGDGSVDFKRGQYFTCSYNYFEGCHKTNLVGSSDTSLQYNLTYHHNYWKLCEARGPLIRNANAHMYNNVFEQQTSYAMNPRANAYIYSEYNLFYMCKNPMDVKSGAIKSYNDSFSSCIGSMGGTIVTDKSQIVPNQCKYAAANIDYSKFETDSKLSYIPSGNYELQENVTEARKVIAVNTGVMKDDIIQVSEVTEGMLSYVPGNVTPVSVSSLPATMTPGKIQKTVYAFTVGGKVDVEVKYATDEYAQTGVLVNAAGECLLTGSGTVRNLPAGTYMIQPTNFQPGEGGQSLSNGTFKSVTIDSIAITASDPNAHYHDHKLVKTNDATCTVEGSKVYECVCGDVKVEPIAKVPHSYGSWTVKTEPTETTEGVKERSCLACGDVDTEKIPATGSGSDTGTDNPGTDNPDAPVVSGGYVYTFEDSGTKSSLFTVSGNTSTGKGSVLYNGVTYKTCLKMESSTNISFTAPADGTLTLVFGGSTATANKGVKINGTVVKCGEDGIVTAKFEKGKTVTVTKGDSINLFYMSYTPDKTDADTPDVPDTTKNGLVCEDDAWKYYKEGKIDTTYVGVVINDLGMWYVSNGTIDWSYTGLAKYGELTCYIKDGAVNSLYTGLINVSDEWVYITDGVVNTYYCGLVNNEYGWWYVANGTIDWTYTNLVRVDDAWWYVHNGGIDFGYTGLYENEYGWWYIKDGKVAEEYCGLVNNENGWWYVSYGRIDWEFTGLIENEHGWWYVMNGGIDFTYTGLVENEYGWWYVVNSGIDFSYTGEATNEYGTWNVVDGKVVF